MSKRFNITLNAKTTAGGIVVSATHFASTNGLGLALEGDAIDCPACHSKGRIQCVGPRISQTCHGKQCALSDDLCICQCNPPPKLIAIQHSMYQTLEGGADEDRMASDRLAPSSLPDASHDLAFAVKDAAGRALADHPYLIELPDGTCLEGVTDSDGMTRKVGAMQAELAKLTVYAPKPSSTDPDWDR